MGTSLTFDEHGDGIGAAWTVIREHANRFGPDRVVPTCPGWRMRDLVAHQGTVHRWATGVLRGERADTEALEAAGLSAGDQLAWFDDGVRELLQALVDAPEDLDAFFFLEDAAPAKFAWARRQCHETSIHAVDAMSTSLGRPPTAAETWLHPALAVDGIDELLTGFVPRPRERLRVDQQLVVGVEPSDADAAWTMVVGPDPVVTTRTRAVDADVVLSGTAVQLYLGLWNRGAELEEHGSVGFLGTWRSSMAVVWR